MKRYSSGQEPSSSLKGKTARTLKWNTIDKVASQVLYAVVGIVLANRLSKEDFGLVGALTVFQAFAILFVDSGFGAALLQKKEPTQKDYSTVFWFNLAVSVAVYAILWFCSPLIAAIFSGDTRLIPLSKVMFLTFVVNGLGIVQTNRLMKLMDVRQIAIGNVAGLLVSGVLGIWLALAGYGPWALVWQALSNSAVKTGWLWCTTRWFPSPCFSRESFHAIWRLGLSVFSTSFLNTLCLHVYSFIIGAFYSLSALGVYTQADKWSKMGSASISQILTASFVPLLSKVQDSMSDFHRYMNRVTRFSSLIMFPVLGGLAVVGEPLFHTLFGQKWDSAIPLFRILCTRGIFVVTISLCCNYLLALGKGRLLMAVEVVKDSMIMIAIFSTVFSRSLEWLVWGQFWASAATLAVTVILTSRATGYSIRLFLADICPFLLSSLVMASVCLLLSSAEMAPWLALVSQVAAGGVVYATLMLFVAKKEIEDMSSRFHIRLPLQK